MRRALFVVAPTCALLIPSTILVAAPATFVWNGGGGDSNWSTPQNWNPAGAPANDGTADVQMAGSTRPSPNVDAPWNIDSLTFSSGCAAFTLSGGPLTVGPGGIVNQSSAAQTLSAPIVLGADQTWNSGSGGLFSNGTVNTNGYALSFVGGNGVVLNGSVTGCGSLVVSTSGSGVVCAYGSNTYSGGTVINQGELYTSNQGLGAAGSPLAFNGGLLSFLGPDTITHDITLGPAGGRISDPLGQWETLAIPANIHGPGSLTVSGGNADTFMNLTGQNTYSGGTSVNNFTLLGTTNSLQGNISLANIYAQVEFQQDFNGVYAGNISGGGELTKAGTGIVTLSGSNTYSGDTQIYMGVLEVPGSGLSSSSRLVFEGGGGVVQFVGAASFTRALGTGVVWKGGGGFSARNGNLTVNIGGSGAQLNFDPMAGGGALSLVFGSPTANAVTELQNPLYLGSAQWSPAPVIQVNAGAGGDYAVLSGQISGANWLLKTGNGTLQLTAANTLTGGLILDAGATQANDGVGLPSACPLQLAGGVLLSNGPATFSRSLGTGSGQVNWAGSGGFAAAAGTLTVNLGGAGAMLAWGAANFVPSGSALVFGAMRASAETLFVNPLNLGTAAREVHVDPGLGGDLATLSGQITGTGGLNKTGAGALTLAASNTYTGSTLVSGGALTLGNTAALQQSTLDTSGGGVLSFGSLGSATLGGLTGPGTLTLANTASAAVALSVGNNNNSTTFSGTLQGAGSLIKIGTGTLTLSGSNTYSGGTTVSGGTLQLGDGAASTGYVQGNILDNATLAFANPTAQTYPGVISGTGSLTKAGTGTLTVTGNNAYSGGTSINAGSLVVTGSLGKTVVTVGSAATLGGTGSIGGSVVALGGSTAATQGAINLADGMIGTLTLSDTNAADTVLTLGGLTVGNPSVFTLEVGAIADRILVTAGKVVVNPGGSLINVTALPGFGPGTYDLMDFPTGQASGLGYLSLATTSLPGYTLSLQSTPNAEQLVVAVPEPGTLALLAAGLACGAAIALRRGRKRGKGSAAE
ncbi:MAG: autotransporter-associated beta strand repeat-containing protein [Thermoguttaceae bacterium]